MDFNDSVVGTTPTDVMQLMMVTQYLDMLKEVGSRDKATTLFIPHSPSAINDIQGQMRQGFMEANLSAASSTRPVVARPTRD